MENEIRLHHIARLPCIKPLLWHHGYLYVSKGYELYRIQASSILHQVESEPARLENERMQFKWKWERVGFFKPDWVRGFASKNRMTCRLLRAGFHCLEPLPGGKMIAVLAKAIAVLEQGETEFKTTWHVKKGTRPLAICTTPDGRIFWGEYFNNSKRDKEVHVYGSEDGGYSWEVVYTFPKGVIRHIHNIVYDPFDDCLWVLTGDDGPECRIIRASCDWRSVDVVLQGSQQVRAVALIPQPKALYFATDTPFEPNHIYLMDRRGKVKQLASTAGSSMYSCQVGEAVFFSTAVEHSEINCYPFACIYGTANKFSWEKLVELHCDAWPWIPFQYSNIVLPTGKNDMGLLAASGVAVQNEDAVMHVWKIS